MRVTYEGRCCVDCLLYLANGDAGDGTDRVAAAIARRWGDDERYMSPSCGDDCDGDFSWSPCDACGSTLGGDRHGFVVLGEGTSDA